MSQYCLGLTLPPSPTTASALCGRLADAVPLLSEDEIRGLVARPDRVRVRSLEAARRIKNQNPTNGCNGFSAAKGLELARVLAGLPFVALSGAGIWTQLNGGRNVGTHLAGAMQVMTEVGCPPEEKMTQLVVYRRDQIPAEAWAEASLYRATDLYRVTTQLELLNALARRMVVCAAIHVSSAFHRLDSEGVPGYAGGMGNHAIPLVDLIWSERLRDWLFPSPGSWGAGWGDEGWCNPTWRHLEQPIRIHSFFAFRGVSQGTNPLPALRSL